MKFQALNAGVPGPPIIEAPTGFLAREYVRRLLGDDTLQVSLTDNLAIESVRIRWAGHAACSPPTLRLQVSTRKPDDTFTEWADK